MKLENTVALVTGGAQRVGSEISLGLANEGVRVATHCNKSVDKAETLAKKIKDSGGDSIVIQGDFSVVQEIERVVKKCHDHFGRIDILINNAAVYYKTPLHDTTEEQWDTLLNINIKASFFCTKSVSQYMLKQKSGKIISIADVAGYSPWPGYLPYSITKAGIICLTKGLAKELAPNIQVNAIAAGTVLMGENATPEYRRQIENATLLKRIGTPQDIVNTIIFLLKGSDYITGTIIPVDGGKLLY